MLVKIRNILSALIVCFTVFSLTGAFALSALAAPSGSGNSGEHAYIGLDDFLRDMNLTFDEYITLVAEYDSDGVYTHFLENNSSRYAAYIDSNPGIPMSTAIALVNVNVDIGPYTDIQEVPVEELGSATMLVNKNFALPVEWKAEDTTVYGGGFIVHSAAVQSLDALLTAMRNEGLTIFLQSTYRDGATSARLHKNAVDRWGWEIADLNWARGGHSEHQSALAADMLHRSDTPTLTEARFENTDEYAWMCENAHIYGFILRYPEEYEHIHGYKFEPWHWRYVGEDIAAAMKSEGIAVYEEFYGKYLASDVLRNVTDLILERRAADEAAEQERLAREEAERLAVEEAVQAAVAALEVIEAAAREAAEHEAALKAEAQRKEEELLARQALEEAEAQADAKHARAVVISVAVIFAAAIFILVLKALKLKTKSCK